MDVDLARQHWRDGLRRIESSPDPARLMEQVELVTRGLRQRIGQVFTMAELADAYDGADDWARSLLEDADPEAPPVSEPGTVADAAFHLYVRGAADYRP
jgi:hypothetical protein